MPRKAFGIGIPRLPVGRTWLIGEVQQTRTLVINLPGSMGGVRNGLEVLGLVVEHALLQIQGSDH